MDGGGGGDTKEGTLGQKLRRGVLISKRGGLSTPVRILRTTANPSSSSAHISARKLAAALYELHQYLPDRESGTDGRVDREASHFMADQSPKSSNQVSLPVTIRSLLDELQAERKSRTLLEHLCDEFAVRIRDYEHELHALKTKYDKEWTGDRSGLILHIAESWLDGRTQMKMEEEAQTGLKTSVIDRLRSELEEARWRKPRDPSRRQVKFEEQMTRASFYSAENQFLQLHETECEDGSCSKSGWRGRASPVQPWMVRLASTGIHGSSSKLHTSSMEKDNLKEGRT